MPTYLGPLGSLQRIEGVSAQPVSRERPMAVNMTMGGKRKGFLGVASRREWSVRVNVSDPLTLAGLSYLADFGQPPFVWLSPEATVTNVLSPRAAALQPGTYSNAIEGPMVTLPGGLVARSVTPSGDYCTLSAMPGTNGFEPVPVVPGQPLTVSTWARGTNMRLILGWRGADGASLGSSNSVPATSSGWQRIFLTTTPPALAAYATVQVFGAAAVAAPALTFSDRLLAFGPGAGCPKAMVTGLSEDVLLAVADSVLKSAAFNVLELG